MSRSLSVPRCLVVGALVALSTLGAAVTPAAASSLELSYQCKIPLIGQVPVSVNYTLDVPKTWRVGDDTPRFAVSAEVTLPALRSSRLVVVPDSAQGEVKLESSVVLPQGGSLKVKVPLQLPNTVFPAPSATVQGVATGTYPSLVFDEPGPASVTIDKFAMNLRFLGVEGEPYAFPSGPIFDIEGNPVAPSDNDPDTTDIPCNVDAGQETTVATFEIEPGFVCNCGLPSAPTNLAGVPSATSVALSWAAATDPDGTVAGYNVYRDSARVATVFGTSYNVTGLSPDTEYSFKVEAVDDDGATSASAPVTVKTKLSDGDSVAPTPPTVTAKRPTTTTATLSWSGSTDDVGVVGYDVFLGDTLIATTTGLTKEIVGLSVGTEYLFKVVAKDAAGNRSTPGTVTVDTGVVIETWDTLVTNMSGTATLKTMVKGSLPMRGSVALILWPSGDLSGELRLGDSLGRLTALGFLPVTAKIGFVPSGQTTGSLQGGVLRTRSLMRIKVKEVKLFGAIPLAGGNNCQTKQLTELNLTANGASVASPLGSGLAGTFAMSDLNGCGALNGLVSPWTAGGGNTIKLSAVPGA
ncbi:MAG: fibronectin type III domain-containing protein [Solirubrobacteraceae bacterium]|nr:fibronectin type III domain-containing protein [Solirubrobacteraceae bacterium]